MKLNQELIEQLRNGEIAVENSGTLGQLRQIVRAAFPENTYDLSGSEKYYFKSECNDRMWDCWSTSKLPTVKISDFYQPERLPKCPNGGLVPPLPPKPKTNPIKYLVDGVGYSLDYQELKFRYEDICQYSDQQFLDELPQIAHLACIVSYFKGLGVQATISDKGIVHELIHLMTEPNEPTNDLGEIREKFNRLIKLS